MNPDEPPQNPDVHQEEPVQQAQPEIQRVPYREEPIVPNRKPAHRGLKMMLAIILVVGGLMLGFFVGFAVSFGACFKSNCSAVESGAPLWIPVASLFVTVPVAKYILKDRS